MMDEAEEEALFARLRTRLAARRSADAELAARIESRVESAVGDRTAELRARLDQLAEHVGRLRRPMIGARRWAMPLVALVILVTIGIAAVVWAGRLGVMPLP